ncbi:hypothetical protein HDU90_003248 [Geranomyces variabilis]|nr:hypothetical protein HDU90_003248 [Geranomyces variabilis]
MILAPTTRCAARRVASAAARRSLATLQMPAAGNSATFPVGATPSVFTISEKNGFLPSADPLVALPEKYGVLESLLQRMPLTKADGTPGLLATGAFGDAVKSEMPSPINVEAETDPALLTALFRDYTFAASAYLLEPCDLHARKTAGADGMGGTYGLGRSVLPKSLAVPLAAVSRKLGAKPFMEYAQSYALYNYRRINQDRGLDFENMELVRAFSGMKSEKGFILVHVAMVAHTGKQVAATIGALNAAAKHDRAAFDSHLVDMRAALRSINNEMETMWGRSAPADYLKFRTFIMGTKNTPLFPNGVVYEGVSDAPTFFRGESGANDSIIPTLDNFLGIEMPNNDMTAILKDFRAYRPENHSLWLSWVEERSKTVSVKQYALADPNSAVLYLSLLDLCREFRQRHWNFTKEYIIRRSSHPIATGGSPIVTWLPNQLDHILGAMAQAAAATRNAPLTPENAALRDELEGRAEAQRSILDREVKDLNQKFKHQAAETDWNAVKA